MDYEKVYNIFKNEENPLKEILSFYNYVYDTYYNEFKIDYNSLYLLKDLIWYNLELKSEYKFGLNNFNDLGSKYKIFSQLDDNLFLTNDEVKLLLKELLEIQNLWSKNWLVAHIYTDIEELKDKQVNQVIIYKKGENPRKYNYYKKTTIIDENNNNIYMNKDVMLCEIDGSLGEYSLNNILYDKLLQLIAVCNSDKKLIITVIG